MDNPRHSNKEIRQFAEWLMSQGWIFDSLNHEGKATYYYPRTAARMSLPETPSARYRLITSLRREAYKCMGIKEPGKSKQRKRTTSQQRLVRDRSREIRQNRALSRVDRRSRECREALGHLTLTAERIRRAGGDPSVIHHKIGAQRAILFALEDKRRALEAGLGINTDPLGLENPAPAHYYYGPDPTASNALANVTKGALV